LAGQAVLVVLDGWVEPIPDSSGGLRELMDAPERKLVGLPGLQVLPEAVRGLPVLAGTGLEQPDGPECQHPAVNVVFCRHLTNLNCHQKVFQKNYRSLLKQPHEFIGAGFTA
jgi:hypothetical protein